VIIISKKNPSNPLNLRLNKMNKEKLKIGFVVERRSSYYKAMASTRLRAYDIIKGLKKQDIKVGLYYPFFKYDVVIFQKAFSKNHILLAEKLKKKETKIILDINVNYLDEKDDYITNNQKQNVQEFIKLADAVITSSQYLKDIYSNLHNNVICIEETIEDRFFTKLKKHNNTQDIYLLYCGYAVKAKELYLIKDVLKKTHASHQIKMIYICEKDPLIDIIPYEFYKYNHKNLHNQILNADININPRDISRKYNLGHSFTKIGYPMALGLPVVASPISSYKNSPAMLCSDLQEWENALVKLISNHDLRNKLAIKGQNFVKENFSESVIIPKYLQLLKSIIK